MITPSWSYVTYSSVKKSPPGRYYKIGGPRSFHKFTYEKINIILVGEVHQEMKNSLAREYIHIFTNFAQKNPTKLFVEKSKNNKKISDDLGFIDCMQFISAPGLEVILSDKRVYDEGFVSFSTFLHRLDKMSRVLRESYKKQGVTPPPPSLMPYPCDNAEFMEAVRLITDPCPRNYSFANLCKFLTTEVKKLDQLHDKYADKNANLAGYLSQCVLAVNDALERTLTLLKNHSLVKDGADWEAAENTPLVTFCLDMLQTKKTFEPVEEWLQILLDYLLHSFDATLICDLWDQIENNRHNPFTFIVATGDGHTEKLASLLAKTFTPAGSVAADKKGSIISPEYIEAFLNDNFAYVPPPPSKKRCVMM